MASLMSLAQKVDSLKQVLSDIDLQIKQLEAKKTSVQTEIDDLKTWKLGAFGTIGTSLSTFNNWYPNIKPNLSEGDINIIQSAYAKMMMKKYFWINHVNLHLLWEKSYNKDTDSENNGLEKEIDMFKVSSVLGYRLYERFAIAVLADYRGTLIPNDDVASFCNVGLGASWKPVSSFYLVVTPLTYEMIFSNKQYNYHSSMGAKFLANYSDEMGNFNFKTNLAAFVSYVSMDYSNWTWTNTLSYTFWKSIGVSFNLGLRQNKQEMFNSKSTTCPTLKSTDNKLQSFWVIGLGYTI